MKISSSSQNRRKQNSGFSMIEMIASVAIMSIIAGVASPVMMGTHDDAKLRVLVSNVDHINSVIREADRFGARGTTDSQIQHGGTLGVEDVCKALTSNPQVWVDSDGDGEIDTREFAFTMDLPRNTGALKHLISDQLVDGYSVAIVETSPVQLGIFKDGAEISF